MKELKCKKTNVLGAILVLTLCFFAAFVIFVLVSGFDNYLVASCVAAVVTCIVEIVAGCVYFSKRMIDDNV